MYFEGKSEENIISNYSSASYDLWSSLVSFCRTLAMQALTASSSPSLVCAEDRKVMKIRTLECCNW